MTRSARLFVFFLLAAAMAWMAFACSGASSGTGIPPVTGIIVRAETVTEGRGCGRAPKQVFKYAVVVFGRGTREPVVGNVYDCFADGTFVELKPIGGSFDYDLEVYVYNEASFTPVAQSVMNAGTDTNALAASSPTWTTRCTATQQPDVQSLALCNPLVAGLAGLAGPTPGQTEILVNTAEFPLGAGRKAACGSTPAPDGGADAMPDSAPADDGGILEAGLDAGADPDAGATSDAGAVVSVPFKTARIRWRTTSPARTGPTVDVECPEVYRVRVDAEPARYILDVGLVDDRGVEVGMSSCEAVTRPGTTSTAVCNAP